MNRSDIVVESPVDRHWYRLAKSVRLIWRGEKARHWSPMVLMVCPLTRVPMETASIVERRLRPKRSHGLYSTFSWKLCGSQRRSRVRMASGGQECPTTSTSVIVSRNSRAAASRSRGARAEVSMSRLGAPSEAARTAYRQAG